MSDYNSSLPIRTESAGDAIVKVADATTPSQQLKVESDGSINVTATATNLDIRDLAFATDKVDASGSTLGANSGVDIGDVTVNNAAGASAVNIQDGGNSITVDGSVTVSATDLDIRDLAFATDKVDASGSTLGANSGVDIGDVTINNAAGASAVNIQDGGNSITVDGSVTVSATDLDIRDLSASQDNVAISDGTDTLAINTDGSINTVSAQPTAIAPSYNAAAAVAAAATSNHDYTTAAAFKLTKVDATGSGKAKIEVQVETAAGSGTFNSRETQFNSTSTPNMEVVFNPPIDVVSGARVRVIRTNRDNQAQDLYSTIQGYNV